MRASHARCKCMWALYYKLAAFIPNAKDVWDFCLGGFKIFIGFIKCVGMSEILTLSIAIFQRFLRDKTLSLPQKSQKA
ncbi:hypothetical protein JP0042_00100 [Helicobacter pylori]|nr:hypothetical protein JP0042_00100 [Helicobacter pylori]